MSASEPEENEQCVKGISINCHAPCENRIIAGDCIEVKLYLNHAPDPGEIQQIVEGAMEGVTNARTSRK